MPEKQIISEKLMPCPFCGSRDVDIGGYEDEEYQCFSHYWVRCAGCGATGGSKNTKEDAVRIWNEASRKANAPETPAEKMNLALDAVILNLADCADMFMKLAESICGKGADIKALKDRVSRL